MERAAQAAREAEASAAAKLSNSGALQGAVTRDSEAPLHVRSLNHIIPRCPPGNIEPTDSRGSVTSSVVAPAPQVFVPTSSDGHSLAPPNMLCMKLDGMRQDQATHDPSLACPEAKEAEHFGRDPADLQAAQGLADLQRGQDLVHSAAENTASNSVNYMANQPVEVSYLCSSSFVLDS